MLIEIKVLPRSNARSRGSPPRVCVLQCDVCDTQYERPYSHVQLDAKVHRCSTKCVYGSRSTDGLGGRGAVIVELECMVCSKPMKLHKVGNERKWGKCCSRKCYGAYRLQHPELYHDNTSAMHTQESWDKISVKALERTTQPDYVHSQTGLKRSDGTRDLIRQRKAENPLVGEKNGMWGKHHRADSREKMSDAHSQGLIDGTVKCYPGNSRHGTYTSSKNGQTSAFKSGWEEATMKWLDANPDVATWDYECVRIPYLHGDHKRWYVPDFLVTFFDDHCELWEVKPKFHRHAEQVLLKSAAARAWCEQEGVSSFRLLTGDDLRSMSVL